MAPPAAAAASSSSIARASGTSRKGSGWDGSASAARSRSSTGCCAAPPTPASSSRSATLASCRRVRYCITLDSDTRLPRDTARELIGIITHPLNRPTFDPAVGRVTDGYGILQPRVSVTFASAAGSLFARLYAGHTGVDPVHDRGLRHLPGSVRRRHLHRQGALRRRRVHGGARRLRAGERAALARPVRRAACPRRAGLRRGAGGRIPVERPRRTPAASTAGFAATGRSSSGCSRSCRRVTASSATRCRSSGAGRFSTTCAAAWSRRRCSRCSLAAWTVLPGPLAFWTDERADGHRLAAAAAGRAAPGRAADRRSRLRCSARNLREDTITGAGAGRAWPDLPGHTTRGKRCTRSC